MEVSMFISTQRRSCPPNNVPREYCSPPQNLISIGLFKVSGKEDTMPCLSKGILFWGTVSYRNTVRGLTY